MGAAQSRRTSCAWSMDFVAQRRGTQGEKRKVRYHHALGAMPSAAPAKIDNTPAERTHSVALCAKSDRRALNLRLS